MGSHSLLPGIFLIPGLNPHLRYWQADSLRLSHQGASAPAASPAKKIGGALYWDYSAAELLPLPGPTVSRPQVLILRALLKRALYITPCGRLYFPGNAI